MNRVVILAVAICSVMMVSAQETVKVTANMTDCGGKLNLYQLKAMDLVPVEQTNAAEDGVFEFTVATSQPEFYYIGNAPNRVVPVVVGPEPTLVLNGSCRTASKTTISNSAFNGQYLQLKNTMNAHRQQNNQLMTIMVRSKDEAEKQQAVEDLKKLDEGRLKLLDSLNGAQPYFAKILALNTYLSYANNQGDYKNEVEYFGNEFFRYVDFQDEAYNNMPWVYESFMSYTNTLTSIKLPVNIVQAFMDRSLGLLPVKSGAQQLAFGGILVAMEKRKHPLYGRYAQQFVETFKDELPAITQKVAARMEMLTAFEIGKVAPDFEQPTPEGEAVKLSDLKGKYLLVDFWASWCGPCRRENPNVVRLYDKYKERGFDILGVSLDRTKDRWIQAIEKDGLEWHHVSDLKGWQNAVAKQYNITSIPRTILLDPEGKIIAKDLRGSSLERKLIEIFGQ